MSTDKFQALRQIPPFPGIATKLMRVLSHEDAQIKEIVDLVRADTALTSELLRLVNSPIYGFPSCISGIQNAITLLGLQAVKGFALTISMKTFVHTCVRLDLLRRVWRHSLACGLICEEISAVCPTSAGRDDRAYTAGLLHNIGSLGLFVAHPDAYAGLLESSNGDTLLAREREAFGFDHCEAGKWLAQKWAFPEDLQRVAASHHDAPDPNAFELIDLVRIGILLADSLGFDVIPPLRTYLVSEIRSMLPHAAQYRFDPDPVVMLAKITGRLDAYD